MNESWLSMWLLNPFSHASSLSVQFPPFTLWMICTGAYLALWLIAFCNNKFFEVVIVSHTLQIHEKKWDQQYGNEMNFWHR